MRIWRNKKRLSSEIDMNRIPVHIAIIMDGNGRWAGLRGMPRAVGHRAGVEALREAVKTCDALGVKYLTVYAFSTENWKRPQSEIGILMSLLKEYVRKELDELHANDVQVRVLGNVEQLPQDVREAVLLACERTKENSGLIFNLAVNYGGRAEIIQAVKSIVKDVQTGKIDADTINEDTFENYLYTNGCPEPELLIRTSGEMRISNFLLWQAAYSELVVVNECWPDFNEKSLIEIVRIFQNRDRRFGGIKKEEE
ncbi:MAG: Ditrans,polycis-undecaprenyl-diphosphate synthase ((2E,6E)-farnesyl-diphosphate specific) [Candidatus Dichloromethanomonas elyunquensis]|nr:MAG: Ditrans,polycis-undecaprenyl-diphosphate synthase ((2E,6E)-farnesyl-diphosphate specific) [Candidatus Dichloromethanomonas elyunquensis]